MEAVNILRTFADPTRLRILSLLANRGPELCVCDIISVLGQPQSTVSRQLGVVRQSGVIVARREGLWMHYSLAEAASPLHEALVAAMKVPAKLEPQLQQDIKRFDELKRRKSLACCTPQSLNGQKCCALPAIKR